MKRGDKVLYVPSWACGDREHADCERGEIVAMHGDSAWVKYSGRRPNFEAPQKTKLEDLVLV